MQTQREPCRIGRKGTKFQKTRKSSANPFNDLEDCFVCEGPRDDNDSCRFTGCRTIYPSGLGAGLPTVSFNYSIRDPPPLFPSVFSREFSPFLITIKKRACARVLLPILFKERVHTKHPNIIRRSRELSVRVTCDVCTTSLFAQSWLCPKCGRELCQDCVDGLTTSDSRAAQCSKQTSLKHSQTDLIPISRFQADELSEAIDEMQLLVDQDTQDRSRDVELEVVMESMGAMALGEQGTSNDEVYSELDAPRFSTVNFSDTEFIRHWSQGVPAVVGPVHFQGHWDPQYFIAAYGDDPVILEDCETGHTRPDTVAGFFETFLTAGDRRTIWKIKDWPPKEHFATTFPELFKSVTRCTPCPHLSLLDGVYNLAGHSPYNAISPDVGPKMYIAYATSPHHHGSTKLHMDITDAWNTCLWAAALAGNEPGYALWHIFSASDAALLRKFIIEECAFAVPGDPIHSQFIYLTPDMLRRLFEMYGIRPYTVRQYPGDTVFIPAYCAHQVANMADAIKIACDFCSMANLRRTQRIATELRHQRLADSAGDDVLQLYLTLWYTWLSLSRLAKASRDRTSQDPFCGLDVLADVSVYPNQTNSASDAPSPMSTDPPTYPADSSTWDDMAVAFTTVQKSTTRRERKQQKARDRKKARRHPLGARPTGPDKIWDCPVKACCRTLNRNGVFDHLKDIHPGFIQIDETMEQQLRRPTVVANSEFMEALEPFLCIPEHLRRVQ